MTWNLLAQIQPSHWFIAAMLLAIGVVLYRSQRKAQEVAGRSSGKPQAMHSTVRHRSAEQGEWEVEMHELARDLSARIDSKLAVLEQLLRTAHHETLRLETAIARAEQFARVEGAASQPVAVELATPSNQARRLEEQTHRHPQAARTAPNALDRPYARIYALADRGCDPQAIAEQVAWPVGEVQLILSLRQRKVAG
jgi:hypothetical protein